MDAPPQAELELQFLALALFDSSFVLETWNLLLNSEPSQVHNLYSLGIVIIES